VLDLAVQSGMIQTKEPEMKRLGFALLALGGLCAYAPAQEKPAATAAGAQAVRGVEDPRAFVEQFYAAYETYPNGPEWPAFAYSDRLRALFEAYETWTADHEDLVGALDFDWWVNAQEWELSDVRVTESRPSANRRVVAARFSNAGRPDEVRFLFVREGSRWYLDDAIEGTGRGDGGWTLSALLRERAE
jgi:hypothetical protein